MSKENVLEIRDLHSSFFTDSGVVRAVNGVDLVIPQGKIIGLVGESGCGKSMTAKSVMGLLRYPGRIESGSIRFMDKELVGLPDIELRKLCGNEMSMIFQEPMTSLNPVLRVGRQVEEAILVHGKAEKRAEAKKLVLDMFEHVGIPEAEKRYSCYPHELSGGLRQRVMIAMAMVCRPRLLIADEPTTALDVTIEAQILQLMQKECRESGMSILLITHNLGVVAEICDFVYVMYAGRIVESGSVFEIFDHPAHPYTRGLLHSMPVIGGDQEYLYAIPGAVPNLLRLGAGCAFCGRCEKAQDRCREEMPELKAVGEDHFSRCFLHETEG
ncbi:MAG: ABC transporter ATP-binding protein [Lachnospiraceae bacterium]|nr:ABC transporter ATP-binding protein [Lachnospiraceae bacterium]